MSRIIGLWCSNMTCPPEEHRLHLKDMYARQNHTKDVTQSILVVSHEYIGNPWKAHTSIAEFGQPPINDETGRWSIVYDGILYNAPMLGKELNVKSPLSCSATDIEVIIHAFSEWGAASVGRFLGMFAFALYDHFSETLYLVRSPFGEKPLYYTAKDGHLWFSSELPTLIRSRSEVRLNKRCFLEWMLHRHLASEETLIQDVYTVRPGHFVKIHGGRVEDCTYTFSTTYVDQAMYEQFLAMPEESVIDEVETALQQSVRDCLTGEEPIGTFCSGGVDSSLVTALTSKSVSDLLAFHASVADSHGFDERRYAEAVVHSLGVRLICSSVDRQTFHRELSRVIALNGMPLAHIHLVPFWLIAQQAHAHGIRVLLTGDSADDHFGGLWYRHRRQWVLYLATRIFSRLPRRLRNALALSANLHGGMPFNLVGSESVIPNVLSSIDGYVRTETRLRFEQAYAFVSDKHCRSALVTMAEDLTERWDLDRADRLGMAAGVECRAPFVHPNVVRLALNLPLPYRFRRGVDKWVVKEIEARYIPRKLVHCKKRPWNLPWKDYLAPLAQPILFRGGFCADTLGLSAMALQEFITSWNRNVEVFWNLLNLELWGRLFFIGESPEQLEMQISALKY
jgi:asparagine synthase (glutamine-hydrolysing)